jgi:hypothetical protein
MALDASSPATVKDRRDTANAATAMMAMAIPGHGASPACSAPHIAMTTTKTTNAAAASPTATLILKLGHRP